MAISPLLQLAKERKQAHPNIKTDAMFPPKAFDALVELVASAAKKNIVDGKPEEIYEPLDHIEPGLPRTLIHVSGSEVLLHDARVGCKQAGGGRGAGRSARSGPVRFTTSSWPRRWCRRRRVRCARSASTSARPPAKAQSGGSGSCAARTDLTTMKRMRIAQHISDLIGNTPWFS